MTHAVPRRSRRLWVILVLGAKLIRIYLISLLCLLPAFAHCAEPAPAYPLWDGHESVVSYAQRVKLDLTKTIDLGSGVKLDFVLIPAGQFIMGTPEPAKPTITVDSAKLLNAIGCILALAMLAWLVVRKRPGRRFSFSLGWMMLFTLACSVIVWGGTRWYLALEQIKIYERDLEGFNHSGDDEKPALLVTITKPFYMGKYAVTQEQYEVVEIKNPSKFRGSRNPVESVDWDDAKVFCANVNAHLHSGKKVRLPSEAQWEFACRAGTTTRFYSGAEDRDLDDVAWYDKNSAGRTHPVGEKKPNGFGLYDMHGNVFQWCEDWYPRIIGGQTEQCRILRGGSYAHESTFARSPNQGYFPPNQGNAYFGFRVIFSLD